jgi:hypothetical protein
MAQVTGHLDYGNYGPRNEIPIVGQIEWDNGFHLEDITVLLVDAGLRIKVIFKRHGNHARDEILSLLSDL